MEEVGPFLFTDITTYEFDNNSHTSDIIPGSEKGSPTYSAIDVTMHRNVFLQDPLNCDKRYTEDIYQVNAVGMGIWNNAKNPD